MKLINFFKENLYVMVKMNVNQLAMCMFGAMMVLAGSASGSDAILVLLSTFSVLFYLYLLYMMFYEMGQKDGIRIEGQRLRYNRFKAIFIALCGNAVNIICGILTVVFKSMINNVSLFENVADYSEKAAEALTPAFAVNAYSIMNLITKVIQCMYVGILKVFFSGNVLMLLVIPLPAIIVSGVAYNLGVKFRNGIGDKKGQRAEQRYR